MFRFEYGLMAHKNVINIDEASVWYNLILCTIFAFSGKLTMVANAKRHSSRLTAVMEIMAAGKILLIF